VKAQIMTHMSSPQSKASVRYPDGGILMGPPLPPSDNLKGVTQKINVTIQYRPNPLYSGWGKGDPTPIHTRQNLFLLTC
jgi:hypothetical protein